MKNVQHLKKILIIIVNFTFTIPYIFRLHHQEKRMLIKLIFVKFEYRHEQFTQRKFSIRIIEVD